ncbi:hypothetical protein SDA59_004463 [Salmonella enterica]|nr:hypothetical protein [Salmonella enterica]EIJ8430770.1 hypothetical protein [Salmonella enterica]EJB9423771.1 hypothetical protein [Salmonella enterica]EJJ5370847.1 hypothetical protein [Salmonella enterica]ELM3167707.1 hypothetical protein [Salmonella enterica]
MHGGGGGSKVEARVAKLESDVTHIDSTLQEMKGDMREMRRDLRSDFRILFGALITVAIGLAGIMARGFHWI